METGIIDFKKQKFIRDCIEYLKTGNAEAELRAIVNSATPEYIEYIKKDIDKDTIIIIDTVIKKIRLSSQKKITGSRQKINIIALATLEKLSTDDIRFEIKEVTERYRETINPVKALYYDLQEIMFLYDGKPKNKHHKFLIDKFSDKKSFDDIIVAVDRDILDLKECRERIIKIREELGFANKSEYYKQVIDLHNEMLQWKRLFEKFPEWVEENTNTQGGGLYQTLKNFFCGED
ncbi:MAG: hypothetical protein CMD92_04760 [Gammaproteobacteria bacterium]|nr:hypothetical protein [Gammaproteobacteria bacterium]